MARRREGSRDAGPSDAHAKDGVAAATSVKLAAVNGWSGGVLAALLSFVSTLALAATGLGHVGANASQIGIAISISCAGIALSGLLLSAWFRMPIFVSWSVPGAALLASLPQGAVNGVGDAIQAHGATGGIAFDTAVAAFALAAAFALCAGAWSRFVGIAERLPAAIAAALLAGLLLPFTLHAMQAFTASLPIAGAGLIAYIVGRRVAPNYALLWVVAGIGLGIACDGGLHAFAGGVADSTTSAPLLHLRALQSAWVVPHGALMVLLSLGLPLFVVSLVAQNLPGIALLRQQGHTPAARPLFIVLGLFGLCLAPFGVFGLNLAPISAALCHGGAASEPPSEAATRRFHAALAYAASYLLFAICSQTLLHWMAALPRAAILCTTGLALLLPLSNALQRMLQDPPRREAALLTFVTGASGVALAGLGAPFWALVVGMIALGSLKRS